MRVASLIATVFALLGQATSEEEDGLLQVSVPPVGRKDKSANLIVVDDSERDNHTWGIDDVKAGAQDMFEDLKDVVNQMFDSFDMDKFQDILADPDKMAEFASNFSDHLQASVNKTQRQIRDLQSKAKSNVGAAKAAAVLKIAEGIDKVARVAQQVVEQLVAKIEDAQRVLEESMRKSDAKADEAQAALTEQVKVLKVLVEQLRQAMNRVEKSLLQEVPLEVPIADAETMAKELATEVSKVLGDAKIYIGYVNKTLTEAEAKMLVLSEQVGAAVELKANESVDSVVSELVALLDQLNQMLAGDLNLTEAEAFVKGASQRVSIVPVLAVSALAGLLALT